jgi:hypothetical protein
MTTVPRLEACSVRRRSIRRLPGSLAISAIGLGAILLLGAPLSARQRATVPARQPESVPHKLDEFAGAWAYNAADSVNAATGRPEQSPRSATQRTPGARGGIPGGVPGGIPGGTAGAGDAAGGGGRPVGPIGDPSMYGGDVPGRREGGVGPTPDMVQESRDLSRDLLEIPESLTIRLTPGAVTFTDDLDRARTYLTNGVKQKYQLGASRFEASIDWDSSHLIKHIEGPYGFRMTETYFLSADARRLFVIIRIGQQRKKDDPVVGVNRVYDRVE